MSKNAIDMNFLVGKSYTYLKRLFGDRVSIPGDFILSAQTEPPVSSSEGQEGFVSVKSTAAQVGSSQIVANGKVLVDIKEHEITPTFITQSVSEILPPVGVENVVKINETPVVPMKTTPVVTPIVTTVVPPVTLSVTSVKAPEVAPEKEVVKSEAPLNIIKETPIEPEAKVEVNSESKAPLVEPLKTENPTKPVEKSSNGLQRPRQLALSKEVIQNQLSGLKKTGLPLSGGDGEIIYQ